MNETIIDVNGVALCAERFGNPDDPVILLLSGAAESMIWWDEEFCRALAAGGRHVIRYDQRDTGRSVTYEPGSPKYDLNDLVDDAVGVLDAFNIQQAHVVGLSLGGIVTQLIAIEQPERILSATLMMSTPHGPEDPDLPPMDEALLEYHGSAASLDWSDTAAVVDFMVAGRAMLVGPGHRFDKARARELAMLEVGRATDVRSSLNHGLIASDRWRERLGRIAVPTLVIHGTDDRVLPLDHGVALAREIPGATLLTLDGTGHEIHRDDWETIVDAILQHTSAGV